MENVFEDFIGESNLEEDNSEESSRDTSFDLEESDFQESEESTNSTNSSDDQKPVEQMAGTQEETPTNNAFARMRTQNKELQSKLDELDTIAKGIGLKGYDDLIAKGKETQIKREATSKGIPVEIARELEELRNRQDEIIASREQEIEEKKQDEFVNNVNEFIKTNNLSDTSVSKLSQDLENDGITIDALMEMPKSAVNRIFSSYIGTDYQKNLERKSAINKELPINQTSKIDTKVINKEIDILAKQLAGK